MTASRTLTDPPKRLELGAADQVLAVPFGDRRAVIVHDQRCARHLLGVSS
jgi:hypothetical protein